MMYPGRNYRGQGSGFAGQLGRTKRGISEPTVYSFLDSASTSVKKLRSTVPNKEATRLSETLAYGPSLEAILSHAQLSYPIQSYRD